MQLIRNSKFCYYSLASFILLINILPNVQGGILDKLTEPIAEIIGLKEPSKPADVFVKHGSVYAFKSVADNSALKAQKYRFTKAGILAGSLTADKFERDSQSQSWDVILANREDVQYWMINHENVINNLNAYTVKNSQFPKRNFVKLVRGGNINNIFLIKSIAQDKCVQNEGIGKEIIYASCDPDSLNQQWTAEHLYDNTLVEETE